MFNRLAKFCSLRIKNKTKAEAIKSPFLLLLRRRERVRPRDRKIVKRKEEIKNFVSGAV
jgi:hypothetical protein